MKFVDVPADLKNPSLEPHDDHRLYYLVRQVPPYGVALLYPIWGRIKVYSNSAAGGTFFESEATGRLTALGTLAITGSPLVAMQALADINSRTATRLRMLSNAVLEHDPLFPEDVAEREFHRIGVEVDFE